MDAEWFGMPVDTEMRTVIQERKHHIATVLRVKPTYQELRHAGNIATNCLKVCRRAKGSAKFLYNTTQ